MEGMLFRVGCAAASSSLFLKWSWLCSVWRV